ncbi:GntR family transcriptional regulator [Dermatophilus congolensis]|uniref:GntR family transcriptional regulator n=1 Tax=Dermatophilus congolensis TaxID=1863 RepID=UPI001AAE71FD|nr:GntR family transcriptional regulator [Dermatophilus congolensis]MBO3132232.1 GntR family transcriptional regulator [Dermatophilus congolensis]MBO3133607.1 GntR family transcriptional regulator [Dermatophilus congolensis]MBO3135840.1 GntR family transcriptional regulator [Dermatophilus congolensis]MBO3138082.1 GntR family transcriptional regulator [Dermatophilus congolensis]
MQILISNSSGRPIYEQITAHIRAAILRGEIQPGEQLPSIRKLARDLHVSVITTTRAYNDLAAEGLIDNVQGKGSYVRPRDPAIAREHALREVEKHLNLAIHTAHTTGLTPTDIRTCLEALLANPYPSPHEEQP